jgi:hypothetical protein
MCGLPSGDPANRSGKDVEAFLGMRRNRPFSKDGEEVVESRRV